MTPAPVARFMASLFAGAGKELRILDPGAGVGSLTAAIAERLCTSEERPSSIEFVCYEIDPLLSEYLEQMLSALQIDCRNADIDARSRLFEDDFLLSQKTGSQYCQNEFRTDIRNGFTHAILNPPYRKIGSLSDYRKALRISGVETSNLYTGFMFLAAQQLRSKGELVAIVPRSFCNGPYYKSFRDQFFSMMTLRQIHMFKQRDQVFRQDSVLQENIIIHAVKDVEPSEITITTSCGGAFEVDPLDSTVVSEDMTQYRIPYEFVIRPDDSEKFVFIATNGIEKSILHRMSQFTATLTDIGIDVSTGPVVDFRLKDDLQAQPESNSAPLLYPAHFQGGVLTWPKAMRKPNAIRKSSASKKWLWANLGHYVVTKRFTTKEERRRIVASIYTSELPGDLVGFENHLNVFHTNQTGMPRTLAVGLSIFLNSSLVDQYFRQFNGHTQVNVTDLRSLRYPSRSILERIGTKYDQQLLNQYEIDTIIEEEIFDMADDDNPLLAQQKIDEALTVLKAFGMPSGQQNERSALTLLAIVDLQPSGTWDKIERPLKGITQIMDYVREYYGREYAPNTRETFRRQTMHQFVEAGIAVYNPDDPSRPVNSPHSCYQVSEEACAVIRSYGTAAWQPTLDSFCPGENRYSTRVAVFDQLRRI